MSFLENLLKKALGETVRSARYRLGHEPTRQKKHRPADRQNHNRGRSKKARKAAARSRRINRGK
jgi:hypothetical protein